MEKKDIYEHLASIYLDSSTKKKKKTKESHRFKNLFYTSLGALVVLALLLSVYVTKTKRIADTQVALLLQSEVSKINFDFDPAKKEIFSIDLKNLNLTRYKTLGFALKKANYHDSIALKVEFVNSLSEKSEIYVKYVHHRWQDFQIPLAGFKRISNWSNMTKLDFVVEQWNSSEKKGIVYIDNIRLLR
jgi:hypothetical protein